MGWGDELMAAGEAQRAYDGREPVAILNSAKGSPRWHVAWEGNPAILHNNTSYRRAVVSGPGHRPYVQSCTQKRWYWKTYTPIPATIYFSTEEQNFRTKISGGFIALEPNPKSKDEAVNRDWGWDKWVELAGLLAPHHRLVQFGVRGTKVLPGVEFIETATPRLMAAGLSKAKAFVSTEGGFHHTAAAVGVKGVVIFGHYISPAVTGYKGHRSLFSGGLGCGSRIKCAQCRDFFDKLTAIRVYEELRMVL